MEIKDAGDFLLPCTTCTRNCFRIHGKHKEEESFDGCSYFFKVMLGDFAKKLRIPPVFVRKLRNEIGSNVILQSPSAQLWDVKLCGTSTEMEFVQGWEKFVHHHKIEYGDFLVFKYICRLYFKVRIFGRSGCQKNVIVFNPGNTHYQHCDQTIDSKLPIALVSDEENNCHLKALARRHPGHSQKKDQIATVKRSYQKSYYVSCRRAVTQAERNQALNAANSFSSDKPFCLITLKPSYVYNTVWLRIPNACRDRLQLPREKAKVILVDPNNKEWEVQYLGNLTQPGLCAGWRYFSFDNNLEEGDVCIFERVENSENKLKLRVYISRVVEKCTPYQWMKGGQINDDIALTANYSNKKMKMEELASRFLPEEGRDAILVKAASREDLLVNMSSTSFGPQQGEEGKQVNIVLREEIAAHLPYKAFEPEQRKDAKQVNTVASEYLTANLSGKAFGPEWIKDAKQVNRVSLDDLAINMLAKALEHEQRKNAEQVNIVSSEELSANLSGKAFGLGQIKDPKQVNTVSREDLAIKMLAEALGPEQTENEKQVNTVSGKDLSSKFLGKVFGLEQRKDAKQLNTVSNEDLSANLSAKAFGPEQRKDVNQVNAVSREDLAIHMLAKELGPEQTKDAKQVNIFSSKNISANLSGKTFGPEQRKHEKQVNTVSRESLAANMIGKAIGHEQGIKQVHGKKENAFTGRNKRAIYTPSISERKERCRRSLRLAQRNHLVECPKKELFCSASSVVGQKSIGRDTMQMSKRASINDVNGYGDEEDLKITRDNNDVTHVMLPISEGFILSQESIHKGPLMTKSTVPVLMSEDLKFDGSNVTRNSQC